MRTLLMRDVESLCVEAGLGRTSKSTVATICLELHEGFGDDPDVADVIACGHRSVTVNTIRTLTRDVGHVAG